MKEALTTTARLFVDEHDVIWIQYAADVQIGVSDISNIYSVIRRWSGDRKPRVVVDVRKPYNITAEAREQAIEETKTSIATAVITSNVLYSYIANIYAKFHSSPAPVKVFFNEAKALEWIRSVREK